MSSRVQDRSAKKQLNKPRRFNSNQVSNNHNENHHAKQNGNNTWQRTFTDDSVENDGSEFDERFQCVICAEKIIYAAKSSCNHTTCHKCTFRQRALYDKKSCLICRTETDRLIFTDELDKNFNDFKIDSIVKFDSKYGIEFTSQSAYDDTLSLLSFKCKDCKEVSKDSKKFVEHLKEVHDSYICTICLNNNKDFPSETKVFNFKDLQTHLIRGDRNGFKGHPLCKFCKGQRFYSEDELTIHLRQNHEKCHVCDQIDPSNPQYFKNYSSLEVHFRHDHFICNVQVCLDKKFVVFADELDLQAHMISEHGGNFGANYVVGTRNNNGFQSQLSTFHPSSHSRNGPTSTVKPNDDSDSISTKQMRLEERARHYLNYSTTSFKDFLKLNNSYTGGQISALDLKSSYQELFTNIDENELYLLLYELSEILPKKSQTQIELSNLISKHEQKSKQDIDFPALPGSSTSLSSLSWSNKSKTKKNKQVLGNEEFPALPSKSTSTYSPVKTKVQYKTVIQPNVKTVVRSSQAPSTYVPNYLTSTSSSTSRPASKPKASLNESEFPALPQVSKKRIIPRVNPIPKGNGAWDAKQPTSASSSTSTSTVDLSSLDDSLPVLNSSKSNKGKKKKQILFQMGGK